MHNVIIIGAGPAGISAALYVKRAGIDVTVLYSGESQLEKNIAGREIYLQNIVSRAAEVRRKKRAGTRTRSPRQGAGHHHADRTPKFDMKAVRKCFSVKPDWSRF